jgi:hypothetical protein
MKILNKIKKRLRGKYLHENWNIGFINADVKEVLRLLPKITTTHKFRIMVY